MSEELTRALEDEAELYRGLLGICAEKREALVALRTQELEGIAAREEALLARIAEADAARRRAAQAAALGLGLPGDATLREIALASKSAELAGLRESIGALVRDVARANDLNGALAGQSLEHVHLFLRALTGLEEENGSYTRRGAEQPAKTPKMNLIDSVA